ncbi:MAG: endonuclease [Clostridia bacterium]|nr:endonuclease [Clostridia bacterium]
MTHIKRTAALLIALLLLFSLSVTVVAADAYTTAKNSGMRDEVCTTLDGTTADAYYTGNYTYETLAQLSEAELLASLRSLMTTTHTKKTSYSDCRDMSVNTDCQGGDGKIVLLYTSSVVTRNDFIGSGSIGWNREHVWPKSLGGFGNEGAGADLHHVRPDDVTTNAVRANDKYGNVTNGKDVKGSSLVGGAVGGKSGGGYFEPLDNVKGDVARICLYVYVRYGGELSQCNKITNVFQSVDVLLQWCALDPVDTWEMGRNEVVGAIQGNRNVFIDYPEYAWLLFGKDIPEDMTTPSGKAKAQTPDAPCTHEQTEVRGAIAATCEKEGYTGDTYCTACGEQTATGRVISTDEGHAFSDWVDDGFGNLSRICTVCALLQSKGGNDTPPSTTPPTTDTQSTGGCQSTMVSLSPILPAIVGAWLFLRKKERK